MQLSAFEFHLITDTRRRTAAGVVFPEHRHAFCELGIVKAGKARWRLNGLGVVEAKDGEGVLIGPGQLHSEEALEETEFAWVGFLVGTQRLADLPLHRKIVFGPWWWQLLQAISRLGDEDAMRLPDYHDRRLLLLGELAILLKRAVLPAVPQEQERDRIEEARTYLERNAGKPLTMMQVARWHGWSLNHFESLFHARFGLSPKRYQQQCRLQLIEQRMRAGASSIKVLAEEHGFQDAGYFCRWFKKQTGCTPAEYFNRCASQ